MGHVVEVIGPDRFRTLPCPTYPDIALSLLPRRRLVRMIEAFAPDALHIATEGPLGHGGAELGDAARLVRSPPRSTPASPNTCRPAPAAAAAGLRLDAAVPRRRAGHDGGDAEPARRTGGARLPPHPRLVARRRSGPVQAGAARGVGRCRGRFSSMSAAWRWRRTSAPSSISTCRARRWWSAAGRSCAALQREYPGVHFTGPRHGEALARALRRRGRVRVPEPDRHVRAGDPGGAGLRHAGRGVPVTGPKDVLAGADGRMWARWMPTCAPPALRGAGRRPRRLPRACRALQLARLRRDVPVAPGAARGALAGKIRRLAPVRHCLSRAPVVA